MAGRDQSANLGGMMSQIGQTVGSMDDAYAPINDALMRSRAPKYNPEDPESIRRYQQYLIQRGEHGIASNLNHVYESALNKRAQGRMAQLDTAGQKIKNIEAGIASNGANPQALAALNEALTLAQQEEASLRDQVAKDPNAQAIIGERTKAANAARLQQIQLERGELALLSEKATATEQAVSNNIAGAILSGAVTMGDYNPEDPEEFFKANPQIAQAAKAHPEAFEDAITRVRETQKVASEIRSEENKTREYTEEDVTSAEGLALPGLVWNQYKAMRAQYGIERANEFLADQTKTILTQRVKEETSSVEAVYNTTTIPLYKRAVEADMSALLLSGAEVDKAGPISKFFGGEDEIVFPEETRKLQLLLEDKDTRAAIAAQVVTEMANAKANPDEETRLKFLMAAIEKVSGPTFMRPEEAQTETDARGRKVPAGEELPVLSPEEAATKPKGTRFRTSDGRIMTV